MDKIELRLQIHTPAYNNHHKYAIPFIYASANLRLLQYFSRCFALRVCVTLFIVFRLFSSLHKGELSILRSMYNVHENEEKRVMRFNGNLLHCVLCWWSELTIKLNVINFNLSFVLYVCVCERAYNVCCRKNSQWNWTHFAGFQPDCAFKHFQNL